MVNKLLGWTILLMIHGLCLPLKGEPRINQDLSVVALNEDGLPSIQVTLHSLKTPGKSLVCKFLLSTASDVTIIDNSVPSEFYWNEAGTIDYLDATGSTHAYQRVLLKRVEVSGLVREGIAGGRVDLRGTMGRMMDEPVDGVLGMSFLRGTRFVYDSEAKRVRWWANPFPGAVLPISYAPNHAPLVYLKIDNKNVPTILDLTMSGGLDLPWGLKPSEAGVVFHNQGMVGGAAAGQRITMNQVDAGSGCWANIPCGFQEGVEWASIGQDVWSAAPVCFDFIQDRLTLRLDEARRLPLKVKGRLSIPVFWDRTAAPHMLTVYAVPPGTPMALAGCLPGDRLISAGELSGVRLNRRNLMALLDSKKPHSWNVLRGGNPVTVCLFDERATSQPSQTP